MLTFPLRLAGGFTLILWSAIEPAVAFICSCLPVLRTLYTHGVAKLGSRTPWSWYSSKRSAGPVSKDPNNLNYTGTTLRSDLTAKNVDEKSWLKMADPEVAVQPMDGSSEALSPTSPLEKPLPPAYTPNLERDTGYHTWSWNLLSRLRDEHIAPSLTRASLIKETGTPWRNDGSKSPEKKTTSGFFTRFSSKSAEQASALPFHEPKTDQPIKPDRQELTISPPSRNSAKNSLGIRVTRPSSPEKRSHSNSYDSWASPSSVPPKKFFLSDADKQPARPKPVARLESSDGGEPSMVPPKLAIRTKTTLTCMTSTTSSSSSSEWPAPPLPLNSTSTGTTTTTISADQDHHQHPAFKRTNSHVSDLAVSPSRAGRARVGT